MAIADSAYGDKIAQTKAAPKKAASSKLVTPTVTIGGAPAGYSPLTPTVTIGGAPAGYSTSAPNYITGANVPNYITGANVPETKTPTVTKNPPAPEDGTPPPPKTTGYSTGLNGELLLDGKPFSGKFNGLTYINGWNQDIYDENGNRRSKIVPGSTGKEFGSDRTLAKDTFKNTLALFFGAQEISKGWADGLYGVVAGFYNSGSTIDEALNLSLQEVRTNPSLKAFTDRFKGIYALQDRLAKGEAIEVPTIAEYFKSESAMGDVLREAGMGDLATQDFLGGVLGLGKSVLEVTNLINDTFNAIDNAPAALKKDLDAYLQLGVSRTDIAKALLTGKEGAQALNKKISEISTLSAAKSQGVTIDMVTAAGISARGYDYNKSLAGFADVKRLERGQMLGKMSGIGFTQADAIAAQFESSVEAQDKIAKIGEEEVNRFGARSGRLASQSRAQGQI
jgi:hypothetical protein